MSKKFWLPRGSGTGGESPGPKRSRRFLLSGETVRTLLIAAALVVSSPLWAAEAPTTEQIIACLPDALRFCDPNSVDRDEIKACLIKHKRQLSQRCRVAGAELFK